MRRIVSILLAIVMILTAIPLTVFGEQGIHVQTGGDASATFQVPGSGGGSGAGRSSYLQPSGTIKISLVKTILDYYKVLYYTEQFRF